MAIFLGFMWVMMALSGVFAYRSFFLIKGFIEMKRRQKQYPYLEKATTENMCKGPHAWDRAKLVMAQLPVGHYRICKDCGYVSTEEGEYKLNAPGIEVYRNAIKLREEAKAKQEALLKAKQTTLDEIMSRLVKGNVQSFDGDLHKNGAALQQFFRKTVMEIESMYTKLYEDSQKENG